MKLLTALRKDVSKQSCSLFPLEVSGSSRFPQCVELKGARAANTLPPPAPSHPPSAVEACSLGPKMQPMMTALPAV